jgi:hypothetical protein
VPGTVKCYDGMLLGPRFAGSFQVNPNVMTSPS